MEYQGDSRRSLMSWCDWRAPEECSLLVAKTERLLSARHGKLSSCGRRGGFCNKGNLLSRRRGKPGLHANINRTHGESNFSPDYFILKLMAADELNLCFARY
jgi:hypothetical protein